MEKIETLDHLNALPEVSFQYYCNIVKAMAFEKGYECDIILKEKIINKVEFICANAEEKSVIFGFDLDTQTNRHLARIGERLAKDLEKYLNE